MILQSSSNTPKELVQKKTCEGRIKRRISPHSSAFQRYWVKKTREWLNNSWELPTPQHFRVPIAGIYCTQLSQKKKTWTHSVLYVDVFLSALKSANMQPLSWAIQKIHFLCRRLLRNGRENTKSALKMQIRWQMRKLCIYSPHCELLWPVWLLWKTTTTHYRHRKWVGVHLKDDSNLKKKKKMWQQLK